MKRIFGLTLVLLLMIGIIGTGTLAAYRNTEPSPNNAFAAGTLNLVVNGFDDSIGVAEFTVTDANPGQTGTGTWTLVNAGDPAGYIDTENITVTNFENYNAATDKAVDDANTSNATGGGELAVNMDVVLFVDDVTDGKVFQLRWRTGQNRQCDAVHFNCHRRFSGNFCFYPGFTIFIDTGNLIFLRIFGQLFLSPVLLSINHLSYS